MIAAMILLASAVPATPAPAAVETDRSGAETTAPSEAEATPETIEGPVLHFIPKAREQSIYKLQTRVQLTNVDVTFEAPAAYHASFTFWTNKMKGSSKVELIEFLISTNEPDEDGNLPFRRQSPRFMIELVEKGQPMEPYGSLQNDVKSLVWKGKFDRYGNVLEIEKVAGSNNENIAKLSIPQMEVILPRLEGPMDLRVGEGFEVEMSMPLPSRLNIRGIEELRMIRKREYILKAFTPGRATFEVKSTYLNDPESNPTEPATICTIQGEGKGEAVFDVKRGVFAKSRITDSLRFDIEAPLKPLPGEPETEEGLIGHTFLNLELKTSATQTVQRVWGEDED